MEMAKQVSTWSKCASRQVGCVLVRDRHPIAVGYNGTPVGSNLCQDPNGTCPRQVLGYKSGEGREHCPAQHAEENAIHNAALHGVGTKGAVAYVYGIDPCQHCAGAMANAGIVEVVLEKVAIYDSLTSKILRDAKVRVRYME
jgi:dCMP deaminase